MTCVCIMTSCHQGTQIVMANVEDVSCKSVIKCVQRKTVYANARVLTLHDWKWHANDKTIYLHSMAWFCEQTFLSRKVKRQIYSAPDLTEQRTLDAKGTQHGIHCKHQMAFGNP